MDRGKVNRILAGILCAAMLVGNWSSTTVSAAAEPVLEETVPEETTPVFEETASEETEPALEETADLPETDTPDESSEIFTTTQKSEISQLSIAKFEVKESGFAAAKVSLVMNNPEGEDYSVFLTDEDYQEIGTIRKLHDSSDEQIREGQEAWTGTLDFKNKDSLKVTALIQNDEGIVDDSHRLTVTRKNKSGFKADVRTKVTGSSAAFLLRQTPYYVIDNAKIKVTLTYRGENGTEVTAGGYPYIYDGIYDQILTGLEENKKYDWTLTCEAGSTTLFTESGTFTTGQVVTYQEDDFPDKALLNAIRGELNGDTSLTNANLAGITSLFCRASDGGAVIKDLEGIQYLTGLKSLYIAGHDITSADQVSRLTELTSLTLYSNNLQTMPDLSDNTALAKINLDNNLLPAGEITAAKLPASFREKNPDWLNATRVNQRPEFSAVTAKEYYATGDHTWPFIAKFSGLKKSQRYTLTAMIDGKEYTNGKYLYPDWGEDLIVIKGISGITPGEKKAACTLTGEDGVTYWDGTVTCSFTESAGGGKKNYLRGTETDFTCTVRLDQTKAGALGENVRLYLENSGGERVGVSTGKVWSYPQTNDDRYQGVFGGDDPDTGYAVTVYSGAVRLANYLEAGSYHVRIVGETGEEELLENMAEVSAVSVVTSVSPHSEIDNTGDHIYLRIYGKNLDPDKVKIRLTTRRGEEIAEFAGVLQKSSDSMVYKYKKKAEFWDAGDMSARWALEGGDCLDAGTYHEISFEEQTILLLHYNYKKRVVEAKLRPGVKDGTAVTLSLLDPNSSDDGNVMIYGSGTGTVKNSRLQVRLLDKEGSVYTPPVSRNWYVCAKLEYDGRTEYDRTYMSWYNYTGSDTVSVSTDGMSVIPIRTGDTTFSVSGYTTKLSAGEKAEVKLLANDTDGTVVQFWSVPIGSGGSFKRECDMASPLPEGSYALRLTAAGEEAALLSNSLFVYDIDKFYIDDQWGSYDKTKNSISVSLTSGQIYGEHCRTAEETINFTDRDDYTVEVYDRLGNEIKNTTLSKITAPAGNNIIYLTIELPADLQKNYIGFYVKIRRKGNDGYLTSNPGILYYASGNWSCDPAYGSWIEAAGDVSYSFLQNTTTSHGYYGIYCTNTQTSNTDLPLTVRVYEAQTATLKKSIKISKFDSNGMYRFSKTDLTGLDESTVYDLELVTKSGTVADCQTGYIVRESSTPTPTGKYYVIFETNGAESPAPAMQEVSKGKTAAEPEAPVKEDAVFTGWYTDAGCTVENQWNFSAGKVTADMTLYAGWTASIEMKVETPKAHILNYDGGEVETGTKVFLTTGTNGAKIYYTTDGSVPTRASALYTDAIVISGEMIKEGKVKIRAFAVMDSDKTGRKYEDSDIMEAAYAVKDESQDWGDVTGNDLGEEGDAASIPKGLWVAGIPESTPYPGKKITFGVRVYDHKKLLTEKKDYTVTYKDNQNVARDKGGEVVAKATVTITGKGNYSGSIVKKFIIMPLDISGEDFTADDILLAYNSKKVQKATPTLRWKGTALKKDTAFKVSYPNTDPGAYKEAGNWEITLTGKGNFTGEKSVTESIVTETLMSKVSIGKIKDQKYTGEPIEPALTVKFDKKDLEKDKDYSLEWENNTGVGTAKVTITGEGDYTGTVTKTFKITGNTFSADTVKIEGFQNGAKGTLPYTGEEVLQNCTLTLKADGTLLTEGTDYSVSYTKNTDAGTATVIYKGINAYTGTIRKTYKIAAYNWKDDAAAEDKRITVSMDDAAYAKDGVNPAPTVTYTYNGESRQLVSGKDYKISYSNNKAAKELTAGDKKNPALTLTGKGNFAGTYKVEFSIKQQNLKNLEERIVVQDVKYQNKANIYKSVPTVMDLNGKKLKSGTDYTVSSYTYAEPVFVSQTGSKTAVTLREKGAPVNGKDIIPVGAVLQVTVTGKGNYTGSAAATFRFAKENLSGASVKVADQYYIGRAVEPGKDQMTVKIGKTVLSKEDYEITDYTNNVKKGTAKVTLRGLGNYGGTKTVTFKIKDRTMGYTIVFDGNGATGGSMGSQLIASTAGKKLTANKFKKTGYAFAGWTTVREPDDEEDVRYADKALFPGQIGEYISGSAVTLYAQWKPLWKS